MAKIVRNDIDELNLSLTLTVEQSDYEKPWLNQLKEYSHQSNMKGFRKGKSQLSILKKRYGKSVLADVINEILQKELTEYIQKEDLNILGYPIASAF